MAAKVARHSCLPANWRWGWGWSSGLSGQFGAALLTGWRVVPGTPGLCLLWRGEGGSRSLDIQEKPRVSSLLIPNVLPGPPVLGLTGQHPVHGGYSPLPVS
jgi:hypothetical protein